MFRTKQLPARPAGWARPGRHWAAYYEDYSKEANSASGHRAVVMQKETFSPLTFVAALWRRDYAAIASYGHLAGVPAGDATELARIVEKRTQPIGVSERTGFAARFDAAFGRLMAAALPTRFHV